MDKRKISLCKWDHVCKPKSLSGLRLRYASCTNLEFMATIGWGLIHNSNDLWVRVLRSKYVMVMTLFLRCVMCLALPIYGRAFARLRVLWKTMLFGGLGMVKGLNSGQIDDFLILIFFSTMPLLILLMIFLLPRSLTM